MSLRDFLSFITLGLIDNEAEHQNKLKIYERERREYEEELREEKRKWETPFTYNGIIEYIYFVDLAKKLAKPIKRLTIEIDGSVITGTVRSQSGISTWTFRLDFNYYGHITGEYRFLERGNYDSIIPTSYAEQLKNAIVSLSNHW